MPSSPTKTNKTQLRHWHPFKEAHELELAATTSILRAAQEAIAKRGAFRIVLAGGTTPRKVYEALRKSQADWHAWYIYFGDERCLPIDHSERNSSMAAQAWLNHVAIPENQIHPIPAEKGATIAANEYAGIMDKVGTFDLVLLGLGEDGHTASLFPNHEIGMTNDAPSTLTIFDAPKPPPQRVSLSARRLSDTVQVMFLITGNNKVQALNDWNNGVAIPAAAITSKNGVDVYIEKAS